MIGTWWFYCLLLMLVVTLASVGYGWGYRGWGPPYPRYVQRRRHLRAHAAGSTAVTYQAWGWGGDFVWVAAVIGILWFTLSFWWL